MEAVRKDSLFHRKLIQISGNKITLKVTDGLQLIESTMKIHTRNKLPDKRDPYTHADIIEAIRNRDIKKCRELLVNHIKWVARKTLSNLDENPN